MSHHVRQSPGLLLTPACHNVRLGRWSRYGKIMLMKSFLKSSSFCVQKHQNKWLLIESYERSRLDNELLLIRIGRRQNVNTVVVQREMIWHTALGKAMWFPSVIGSRLFPQETGFGFVSRLSKPQSDSLSEPFGFFLPLAQKMARSVTCLQGPCRRSVSAPCSHWWVLALRHPMWGMRK